MATSELVLTLIDPRSTLDPLFCGPEYDIESSGQKPRRYEDLLPMPRMKGVPQVVDRWNPAWRWYEACLAKGRVETSHRGGDPIVYRDLAPYLAAKDAQPKGNYAAELDLNTKWPELVWAERHWMANGQIRFYLEAMVLAGAPRDLLANILGVEEAHIVWFERAFWDIRPYLSNPDRITLSVLLPAKDRAGAATHKDAMWKLLVGLAGFDYKEFMSITHPYKPLPEPLEERLRVAMTQHAMMQVAAQAFGRSVNRYTDEMSHTAYDMHERHRQVRGATGGVKASGYLDTKEFKEATDALGMAKLDLKFTGVEPNDYMDVSTAFNNRVRSGQYLQYEKPVTVGAEHDN
jgi:hypothetical protein